MTNDLSLVRNAIDALTELLKRPDLSPELANTARQTLKLLMQDLERATGRSMNA